MISPRSLYSGQKCVFKGEYSAVCVCVLLQFVCFVGIEESDIHQHGSLFTLRCQQIPRSVSLSSFPSSSCLQTCLSSVCVAGDASAVADMQRGVRCIQFHPRGHQLALGDRAGNIR